MKHILLLVLLAPIYIYAQTPSPKITIGESMDVAILDQYFYSDGMMISVYSSETQTLISKYNIKSLKSVSTKIYDNPQENKTFSSFDWIQLQDKLYLIYSWYYKKEGYCALYAREIDFEKGLFSDQGKEIFRLDGGMFDYERMRISVLKDGSSFVVASRIESKEKSSKHLSSIDAHILDNNFNVIGGGQSILGHPDSEIDFTSRYSYNALFSIDSKGYPYILIRFKDKANKGKLYNELVKLPRDNSSKNVISKFSPKSPYFKSRWLEESPDGGMIYGGLLLKDDLEYEEEDLIVPDVSGYFIAHVNEDGSFRYKRSIKFPLKTVNQNVSTKEMEKNKKNISKNGNLILPYQKYREAHTFDNGSYLFINEEYRLKVADQSNGISSYNELLGDVYASKIDKDGSLVWMKKIAKNQKDEKDSKWSGYNYINLNNNHYFIFQDSKTNASLKKSEEPLKYNGKKDSGIIMVTIDDVTGEMSREVLLDLSNLNGQKAENILIKSVSKIDDNTFVFLVSLEDGGTVFIKVEV